MAEFRGDPPSEMNRPDHLTAGEIAGYLDRDLAEADRHRVEHHLEACAECRGELTAVARLADSHAPAPSIRPLPTPRPARRQLPLALAGALAAGLAALFLIRPGIVGNAPRREPVRAPDFGEGRARLEIVSPSPDSIVAANRLALTWHSSQASLYRVTVLSESADPLYTADTRDTSIALPDSITLLPGRTYFWRVEGIANGIVSSTGATRLRVRP